MNKYKNDILELSSTEQLAISGGGIREQGLIVGIVFEWNRRLAKGMWDKIVERWND